MFWTYLFLGFWTLFLLSSFLLFRSVLLLSSQLKNFSNLLKSFSFRSFPGNALHVSCVLDLSFLLSKIFCTWQSESCLKFFALHSSLIFLFFDILEQFPFERSASPLGRDFVFNSLFFFCILLLVPWNMVFSFFSSKHSCFITLFILLSSSFFNWGFGSYLFVEVLSSIYLTWDGRHSILF